MPLVSSSSREVPAAPLPEAVSWSSGPYVLRGMLSAQKASLPTVVVLCNALWEEGECSRRVLAGLGEYLALRGIAALRFDYAGTGESSGHDYEVSLADYQRDLLSAVAWARARLRPSRVIVIAVRSGCNLFASLVPGPPTDGLVLIDPIADVQQYWREMYISTKVVCPGLNPNHVFLLPNCGSSYIVRHGHRLNPEVAREVDLLQLRPDAVRGISHVLLVTLGASANRNQLKLLTQLRQHNAGVAHTQVDAPLFWRSHETDRVETERYQGLYRAVLAWLSGFSPRNAMPATTVRRRNLQSDPPPRLAAEWEFDRVFVKTSVGPVALSVHVPDSPSPQTENVALILLPAMPQDRSGPQRLFLRVAQAFSSAGVAACRLDHIGCGDSGGRSWRDSRSSTHIGECLDYLRTRGMTRFVLVGLCSGATLALRAALSRQDVIGLALLNHHRHEPGAALRVLLSGLMRALTVIARGVSPVSAMRLFGMNSVLYRLGLATRRRRRVVHSGDSGNVLLTLRGDAAMRILTTPLLIVYGEHSRYLGAFRYGLAKGALRFLKQRQDTSIVVTRGGTDAFHLPDSRTALVGALITWVLSRAEPAELQERNP